MTDTNNPPPPFMPFPPDRLDELLKTPGWYAAGFRAWGLVFAPGETSTMVAGGRSEESVWWMLNKAAECCNIHSGFSAVPPASAYPVRGVGCDLALIRDHDKHGPNPGAEAAVRALGAELGTEFYPHPLAGTVCLYMPRFGDADDAAAWAPELVAAVATAADNAVKEANA